MTVICPKCKTRLQLPDGATGRRVKCPKCGEAVLVGEAPVRRTVPRLPVKKGSPAVFWGVFLGVIAITAVAAVLVMHSRKPAPPPAAAAAPEPEGYPETLRRAMGFLHEAQQASGTDFDTKRRAYTQAEEAFRKALAQIPVGPDAENEAAQIRSYLFECHKSKPMP